MAIFIPSILTSKRSEFNRLITGLSGLVDRIQVDIADGSLVSTTTLLPNQLPRFSHGLSIDAHLMVDRPSQYYSKLADLGVDRVVIHMESKEPVAEAMRRAHKLGLGVALAINPESAIEQLEPYRSGLAFIQLMAVHPGAGGRPFIGETYDRIKRLKQLHPKVPVAVDGGVRLSNVRELWQKGASIFCVGSGGYAVDGDLTGGIKQWQDLLYSLKTE